MQRFFTKPIKSLFKPQLFAHGRTFSHFLVPYYPLGSTLSLTFEAENKKSITEAKKELLSSVGSNISSDLKQFINVLFDYKKTSSLICKIDSVTTKMLSEKYENLIDDYKKLNMTDNDVVLKYLKNQFLPSLRSLMKDLATYYEFDNEVIESSDGLLIDDDYIDLVKKGKLILDIGEDGHGPFPHIISAFMMKELEKEGNVSSAKKLYQSLGNRTPCYCPDRVNFLNYFYFLMDSPQSFNMFCNPSSFSNHLLNEGHGLKQIAAICKQHSRTLSQLSFETWDQEKQNVIDLSRGKVHRI